MRRTALATRGASPEVVNRVIQRDGWRCIRCGQDIGGDRGLSWSLHHRRYRDGRPDSHTPQNLITVCGAANVDGCHGAIHASKTEAMASGWSITRHGWADPLIQPVLVAERSRWVYLTADGRYSDTPVVAA